MRFFPLPTTRGGLLILLTAAAMAVAFMNSGLITALTAALLAAVVLAAFIMACFSISGLELARTFLHDGVCGNPLYLEITVKNKLPFYRQSCTFHENYPFVISGRNAFVIPALAPHEKRVLPCCIQAEKRGEYFPEKVFVCSGDPWGLFRKKKKFHLPARLDIYPRLLHPENLAVFNKKGNMPDPDGRNLGHAGRGSEFFGVRPFRTGDEMRHIHWKATASKGQLMVKEFEATAVDQIVILLDTEKKNTGFDLCDNNLEFLISCAFSITEYLSKRYCHLRFFAADGQEGLHHLTGDGASLKGKLRRLLTLLRSSTPAFQTVLAAAAENIPQRSIVCLLTMSLEKVPEYIRILEEQDCTCFWIYAPKEAFPPIEQDTPRFLNREKIKKQLENLPEPPVVADFTSGAEILEAGEGYEKL